MRKVKEDTIINGNIEYVNCNLCKSDDTKLLFIKSSFNIVQCRKCGLVYVNPRHNVKALKKVYTKGYYSGRDTPEYAEYVSTKAYEDYIGRETELKTMFRKRLKRIEKYKKGGRLLDIGCAVGFFLEVAKEDDWETFGVELSEYASNYARERGLNIFTGDVTATKFPDEYFDVITLWAVISNLQNPYNNLIEAYRILKKKGLIAIQTGDINSIFAKLQGVNWRLLTPEGHLYYFSPKTLRKMLELTGFEIVKRTTHGDITQNERIKNLIGYKYVNWFIVKKLGLGDIMTIYALKI
ncbi:MAG: class I SAM-dependent methyltransferase [Thermoplasmatales archaeon]|nr:class I SAM-dependent methyltransferase [Thermoplasmatales archaeon]